MPRAISTPGAGTAAVITLAATSGIAYGALSLIASYNALTAVGTLTIAVAGTTIISLDVSGQGAFTWEEDISGEDGEGVVITLSGILLVSGKLNVNYVAVAV